MIIFLSDINLIQQVEQRFPYGKHTIFNLSSSYSGFMDISCLIRNVRIINNTNMPHNQFIDTVQFDMQYAAALNSDPCMNNALKHIMARSYEGDLAIILVSRDPYRDALMESLIKYIQQMYGHSCWIVEDLEDLDCIKDREDFTPDGILRLDAELRNANVLEPVNIE